MNQAVLSKSPNAPLEIPKFVFVGCTFMTMSGLTWSRVTQNAGVNARETGMLWRLGLDSWLQSIRLRFSPRPGAVGQR